jgi:GNAT superfamily N-acetyltransferase
MSAHDSAPLHALIARLNDFSHEEQQVALELVEAAAQSAADYEVLVALESDTLSGYVCFGKTPMTAATYDLYWLATCPDFRKRGVARDLVSALLDQLGKRSRGGLLRVETSSREAYSGTRAFYLALGFVETACVPRFYAPDDDLIIFTKAL